MRKRWILILIVLLLSGKLFAQFSLNSFNPKIDFATPASPGNPQGCYAADLNGDGKPELIVANLSANTVSVYTNVGTIGVISSSTYAAGFTLTAYSTAGPSTINVEDLDGDGKNDILVGYGGASNNRISIFKNEFNGVTFNSSSFTRYDYVSGTTSTSAPNSVYAEDLSGDGKKELIMTNYGSASFSILQNYSTPGTLVFTNLLTYTAGTNAAYVAFGDFNQDGKKDIAISNWGSNSISVFRNSTLSPSTIFFSPELTLPTGNSPHYIKSGDIDGDGKTDLAVANYYSNTFSVWKNNGGSGSFSFASRIDVSLTSGAYPQGLILNDLDYDGRMDVAVNMAGLSGIMVFKNNYTGGTFSGLSFSAPTTYAVGTSPVPINAIDIDGDYRPELFSGNYSSNTISVLKNRNLSPEPTVATIGAGILTGMGTATITLTKGNGTKRLVVMRATGQSSVHPADTSWYTASLTYGSGSNLGSGNYVVYADTGSIFTVSGLTMGTSYDMNIYEYNGIGGFCNYLTSSFGSFTITLGDVYYSKSTGSLNLLACWGRNPDGSGSAPVSFNNPSTTFVVVNNPSPSISSNWIVSGSGSYVVVGDGTNALNLSIPGSYNIYTDSIAVKSMATITFTGGLISNKVYFDTLSTAQFNDATNQSIPGFTYYNLVAAGGFKNLTNHCTVKGSLNLLTSINTGIYTLTLGISAAQPGILNRNASGVVIGRLKRWFAANTNTGNTGLFPMATSTLYYRPVQIDFTSAPSVGGTLTAEFISSAPGNSGLPLYDFSNGFVEINKAAVNGYWKVDAAGISGGTYTVTLTGSGFTGVNVVADLRIVKRNTSGAWFLQGTAITGTGTTLIPVAGRSGMSGFGEFTLSGDSTVNPLPVTWLHAEAHYELNNAVISWSTASEHNNAGFDVERAANSPDEFTSIGHVNAQQKGGISSYRFEDRKADPLLINFYRIKQTDKDGSFTYSDIMVLEPNQIQTLSLYPNPGNGVIHIENGINCSQIRVFTSTGDCVFLGKPNPDFLDLSSLNVGFYLIELTELNGTRTYARYLKE